MRIKLEKDAHQIGKRCASNWKKMRIKLENDAHQIKKTCAEIRHHLRRNSEEIDLTLR
jgi:hypothetical protein